MISHILVPLDGSRLAESAIPPAVSFTSWFGASVTLLHVMEKNAPAEVHGDRHLTDPAEASAYLEGIRDTYFAPETTVRIHVHESPVDRVAESISFHSGEFSPDLIVMCTHGGGGLKELVFGSIARKVVAEGNVPVLLVRPDGGEPKPFACRTILLPLDPDESHSQGIETAVDIARSAGALLSLVMVVPTLGTLGSQWAETGRLLPGTTGSLLDMADEKARQSLGERMHAIRERGVRVEASVQRGGTVEMIAAAAREAHADLIVLATHGRQGIDAFWSESVAPRIIATLDIPLLLIPVDGG
jgi:nucleotide-binding universal stress UspA family protein